tara:strand:- start:204 stop:836 length:633 start_codon:yes stop_codon:yes gene_type:complete
MKKFIKSHQVKIINVAFLIGGIFIGSFGYDAYWEYKFTSLENEEYTFIDSEENEYMLRRIEPSDCDSSSHFIDQANKIYSCNNLFDTYYSEGWKSGGNDCSNESITFYFDKTYYIEFMTVQNFIDTSEFNSMDKINDFRLSFPYGQNESVQETHYLVNDNFEQWKDINKVVDEITFEIISYYDTPGTNICGLQEITFYGKDVDETTKGNS